MVKGLGAPGADGNQPIRDTESPGHVVANVVPDETTDVCKTIFARSNQDPTPATFELDGEEHIVNGFVVTDKSFKDRGVADGAEKDRYDPALGEVLDQVANVQSAVKSTFGAIFANAKAGTGRDRDD